MHRVIAYFGIDARITVGVGGGGGACGGIELRVQAGNQVTRLVLDQGALTMFTSLRACDKGHVTRGV